MNEDELKTRLSAFTTPPASEMARERARYRALRALREGGGEDLPASHRGAVVWPLAGAAALALAAAIFWPRTSPSDRPPSGAAVLAQVEALFPGQLDAVIERDGDLQLALASVPGRTSDQPLLVEFRRGESLVRVLSYSGRRVCVDLGGQHACFEVLLGERGHIIVAGEDFVWTAQDRVGAGEWKITATALGRSS